MTKTMDFGTLSWLGRRKRDILQQAELDFWRQEAEKMASEIETMIDELKAGKSVILSGMTIAASLPK